LFDVFFQCHTYLLAAVVVVVVPLATNVGAVGAVVSGVGVSVVTLTELLLAETFPAASFDFTVNE
jgi:hypothetical protein